MVLQGPDALPGPAGGDLLTRAITQIIADTQAVGGPTTVLTLRVIAPFDADLVVVVTALDLADARRDRPPARGQRGPALLAADDPRAVPQCPVIAVSTSTAMVFTDVARGGRDGP